jgi:hypothetical protein
VSAAFAAVLAPGCAERGDFGRPKETALSALVMPVAMPTKSNFAYTDDEQELRARAWRFLMPAKERWWFDGFIHDLARTGYIPAEHFPETLTWYKEDLVGDAFRSPASVFHRLAEDVSADRALAVPFAASAARVAEADRIRRVAMGQTRGLGLDEEDDARIRIKENRVLIAWVCNRLAMRAKSYRYALEHLFVAMPQAEAIKPERQLMLFDHDLAALRATGCIRPDPFRDIAVNRGLRMPPDGHFWSEEVLSGPAAAAPPSPPTGRVIKQ